MMRNARGSRRGPTSVRTKLSRRSAPAAWAGTRHRFFLFFAVAAFLIVFAGFSRAFFLKFLFATRALPFYLYLHVLASFPSHWKHKRVAQMYGMDGASVTDSRPKAPECRCQ